jgi:hypothetical protein
MRVSIGLLIVLVAMPAAADSFSFDAAFTTSDFGSLAEAVADVVTVPNLGPAEATGLRGFSILAATGGPQVDGSAHWFRHGIDGSTTAGLLLGGRIIARKGLPWGLDVGGETGRVEGSKFWGAEARWALVRGGMLQPALALRASYAKLEEAFDLNVKEVQLVLSKGFAMLTPYVALGYRRVEASARFGEPVASVHALTKDRVTGAAGVRLTLFPFQLVGEVRQGFKRSVFVGVGVGL